jgi:hypothetical protein
VTTPDKTLKEIDEINVFFREHQGRGVQIWRYNVSHSWLELVMMHAGEIHWEKSTAEYTAINCIMTHAMNLPTISWRSNLSATETLIAAGNKIVVVEDKSNGTRILCDHLFLSVGRHPDTPTYPIPNGG